MTAADALGFIRKHGVVLVSARGPAPKLVDFIAAEPVKGSWWAHPKSRLIFAILETAADSPEILACRLIDGKTTFVHRRLWPALVRAAGNFPAGRLAKVRQEHTPSGRHVNREIAFPKWVPGEILEEARRLTERQALDALGPWARRPAKAARPTRP